MLGDCTWSVFVDAAASFDVAGRTWSIVLVKLQQSPDEPCLRTTPTITRIVMRKQEGWGKEDTVFGSGEIGI